MLCRTCRGMSTSGEFVTDAERMVAAALARPLPLDAAGIKRRILALARAEHQVPAHRARVRRCEYCSQVFQGATRRARFCGQACRSAARREARRGLVAPRTCPVCQDAFLPARASRRYCATTCREQGRVERQRDARALARTTTAPPVGQDDPRGSEHELAARGVGRTDDPPSTRVTDPWVTTRGSGDPAWLGAERPVSGRGPQVGGLS